MEIKKTCKNCAWTDCRLQYMEPKIICHEWEERKPKEEIKKEISKEKK